MSTEIFDESSQQDIRELTEEVEELLETRNITKLSTLLRTLALHEIEEVLESLPVHDAAVVFRLVDKDRAISLFDTLDSGEQRGIVAELSDAYVADFFGQLEPEEQARLLDELPAKVVKRLLASVDHRDLGPALVLLGYPSDSVGRRMSPEEMHTFPHESVGSALDRIRQQTGESNVLAVVPVLGTNRTLVGVVDVLDLLRAPANDQVASVMNAQPRFAYTDENAEHVAHEVLEDGLLVLPVVDREERLVGIVPISDAARIEQDAAAEDQARSGATDPLNRSYLLTPVRTLTRSRIVWLLILAVSAILTVQVLEFFETTLSEKVALALFVPLLIGIGGNVGSQAATTITRALALNEVAPRDVVHVVWKEARTGFVIGFLLGVLAFIVATIFYGIPIGTVIGLTLLLNCPIAATVGGTIPLIAKASRLDPAVLSTPFISTFCDATGLIVYFTVAISVLNLG